jgi:hypothetical protein
LTQGDALSPLLFNFLVEYVIRRHRVNQEGLKFNGTHQLMFMFVVLTCILGQSVYTIKKNTEVLVFARKEIGLEVNADKAKYMVVSRDQSAG